MHKYMYVQTIDGIATSFYACFYIEGNFYVTKQAQVSGWWQKSGF